MTKALPLIAVDCGVAFPFTRARDWLLVTGVEPVSEFLDDFVKEN